MGEEEEDEGEGQKEEEEKGRKRGKQVGKYGLVLLLMQKKTQQAFLKHESPLMEHGDKLSHTHAGCVYVCECVPLQLKTSMSGFVPKPPSKVIYCT